MWTRLCEVSSRSLGPKDDLSCSRCAGVKPCQRRGFQFLFSEHQIGFFKSGALHIDHKNTCISCRKGNIADVGSMREYDMHMHCMLFMSYSFRYSTNLPRSSWHAWRCSYEALRHSGWGGLRHVIHPKEAWRIMKVGLSGCPTALLDLLDLVSSECRVHSQIFRQVICTIPRLTALLKQAWVSHSASIPREFAIVGDVGVVDVF